MTEQAKKEPKHQAHKPTTTTGTEPNTSIEETPAARETKIGKVVTLLERDEGVTLDEMVEATGWQPHTTRAALTGLKKKGHVIERLKRDNVTFYRIAKSA